MTPILLIAGPSGTGKTTFIEKLVPELRARGYRIAVMKHTDKDVEWDVPGKDSWRHVRAGSEQVVLCTPTRVMTTTAVDHPLSLDEALRFVGGGHDLVIIEGFHEAVLPRIEVHRKAAGPFQGKPGSSHQGLMGIVTDEPLASPAPQFAWEDVGSVADLVVRKLLSGEDELDVGLFVNGAQVRTSPFVAELIAKTVEGMVSALKGVARVTSLDVWVRKR